MKTRRLVLGLVATLVLGSCAHQREVYYPKNPGTTRGGPGRAPAGDTRVGGFPKADEAGYGDEDKQPSRHANKSGN